jgi:hypothetical protein
MILSNQEANFPYLWSLSFSYTYVYIHVSLIFLLVLPLILPSNPFPSGTG